ncbi:MAG: PIN domain-containing protein [Candidatus Moraniibacteriota bacterium]
MIYRTLIIFDTNKIRHTDYIGFELGSEYDRVKKFIEEKNLKNIIQLAIPAYVIEEIKKQKIEKFENELEKFEEISKKFERIKIVKKESSAKFDIKKYINKKALEFLSENNIRIMNLNKENYAKVFERIIKRAIDKKLPFKRNDKHSDIGFKDVLIWETILDNKGIILWNDNIFYCSGDNGFGECKEEFEKIYNRNFDVFSSVDFLIEKLSSQYTDIIENNKVFSLVQSHYFTDQIEQYINSIGFWNDSDGDECDIINIDIYDQCVDFEKVEGNEDTEEACTFEITSYGILYLEKEDDDGKIINSDVDVTIITVIDENNEFIDFEIY